MQEKTKSVLTHTVIWKSRQLSYASQNIKET